jgi:DNA-binding LacI/PurR family transcriptional regulator
MWAREQSVTNKVTIYDVAIAAGVSISTVSLALNSPTRVTTATREKILAAADELGFVPKADAVTRARRGVGRIGVVAPFSSYPSFARRLNGIFGLLADGSLEVVVFDQESASTMASPLLASLPITQRLDGMVIMALPLDEAVAARLKRQRLPTVLIDSAREDFDCVSTDDRAGGVLAAEHLVERGHRRLGYLGEDQRSAYLSSSVQRLGGFTTAALARGAVVAADAVRLVSHGVDEACQATHELLDLPDRPTGVFAYDDVLAAGVLKAARQRGLTVPTDLAVVGFDDAELADALDLTTVRQPFEESGRAGVQLLLERMQNTAGSRRHIELKLTLVPRATT